MGIELILNYTEDWDLIFFSNNAVKYRFFFFYHRPFVYAFIFHSGESPFVKA